MKVESRYVGLAMFVTVVLLGVAHGQKDPVPTTIPPPPPVSAPENAGGIPKPPAPAETPGPSELPALPMADKVPTGKTSTPGQGWETDISVKDLIIDATEG